MGLGEQRRDKKLVVIFVYADTGGLFFFRAIKVLREGIYARFTLGFLPGSKSCQTRKFMATPFSKSSCF